MTSPYNIAFACLVCRKSFKRCCDEIKTLPEKLTCPECGGDSFNCGRHFKAPKQADVRQWEKIKYLLEHGFRFQKIGVPYPETLKEAKEFVIKYRDYAIGQKRKRT